MVRKRFVWGMVGALWSCALPAWADSIAPASYSTQLAVGGSATITKTVTVDPMGGSPVDVFFLMDTTSSMASSLSDITTNFGSIATSISGLSSNVAFGVGSYNDCVNGTGDCPPGTLNLAFTQHLDLTTDTTAVQTALGTLTASGGGDGPESNLYGLHQAATTTSWRPDSNRFLFWAGDIYGHDPRQGVTQADATNALIANNVKTYALDVGSLDFTGQATAITTATGGQLLTGGYTEISNLISNSLAMALLNYSEVTLDVVGLGAGVDVAWTPVSHMGEYDRSISRDFLFDVTFSGLAPGTYNFDVVALVDGNIVAREADRIIVDGVDSGPLTAVPEPSTFILLGGGLLALLGMARRRRG